MAERQSELLRQKKLELKKQHSEELNQLNWAIEQAYEEEHREKLRTMPPARRRAVQVLDELCADPDMWGTHGCPGPTKLKHLEDEFTRAFETPPDEEGLSDG